MSVVAHQGHHQATPVAVAERTTTPRLHVGSEVGTLRRVMLHRPDLELRRLTPTNVDEWRRSR